MSVQHQSSRNERSESPVLSGAQATDRAVRRLVRHRERLRRRERLTAIGEAASTLIHEIRNPLAVIGGFARELRKERDGKGSGAVPLDIIVNEVSRLENLVDNVLGFARTSRPCLRKADLNTLVREAFSRRERLHRQAQIGVSLELADDLPGLLIDRDQLVQVLDNLCENAVRAMPHGGTITVTTSRAGEEVLLRVSDTGPGVPAALRAKVFEPFYSSSSDGTGLGLAVATRIMDGHGGRIRLESGGRRGAAFLLLFPVPRRVNEA
jgi:signal transduction histidine kinase